jgi:hypothetical protein
VTHSWRDATGTCNNRSSIIIINYYYYSYERCNNRSIIIIIRFGSIQRVYLAKDRETGMSRGFAFINFYERDDAQKSIDKLDGHGYDHLILSVSWAAPSDKK